MPSKNPVIASKATSKSEKSGVEALIDKPIAS